MVAKIVNVISIISVHLLCNCISSVHSGPIMEANDQHIKSLLPTTLRSIGDGMKEDVEPIEPVLPTVNPTEIPVTSSSSSTTTSSTTVPSTTTNSSTISTTVTSAPSPTVAPPPPLTTSTTPSPSGGNNTHFDGPSFIGGIVLAAGLACIGFVGFKVYRARTERNYHTL